MGRNQIIVKCLTEVPYSKHRSPFLCLNTISTKCYMPTSSPKAKIYETPKSSAVWVRAAPKSSGRGRFLLSSLIPENARSPPATSLDRKIRNNPSIHGFSGRVEPGSAGVRAGGRLFLSMWATNTRPLNSFSSLFGCQVAWYSNHEIVTCSWGFVIHWLMVGSRV